MIPKGDLDLDNVLELMPIPGRPGEEAKIAGVLRDKLVALGVPGECIVTDQAHRQSEIGGQVGNLIVRLNGHGRGERRMLSTHMDTIPRAVGCRPRVEGDRIVNDAAGTSLGADARAGCAVLLAAARALLERRGDHPPCTLVFFVQEEIGLVGARYLEVGLLGDPRAAMAFNFDGLDVARIVHAVIGAERLHIEVHGVASHSSRPQHGISAAVIACRATAELTDAGWHGVVHQAEGEGWCNLGVLQGGSGSNVVMPRLYALVEARAHDKNFRSRIIAQWKQAFAEQVERANAEASEADGRAEVCFRPGPVYDPYALPEDAPVVRAAREAVRRLGCQPVLVRDDGGQDSAWIVAHGIPTVGLGMGCRDAHSEGEWLSLEQFSLSCRLAAELATAEQPRSGG